MRVKQLCDTYLHVVVGSGSSMLIGDGDASKIKPTTRAWIKALKAFGKSDSFILLFGVPQLCSFCGTTRTHVAKAGRISGPYTNYTWWRDGGRAKACCVST